MDGKTSNISQGPSRSIATGIARASAGGPLGTYRPASRDGIADERPQRSTSRFGFSSNTALASSTNTTSSIARPSALIGKRKTSNAGLQQGPSTPTNGLTPNKRAFLTTPATASRGSATIEAEYKRKEILSSQMYEKLQSQYAEKCRELEKEQDERLALLRQWDAFKVDAVSEREKHKLSIKTLQERANTLQTQNVSFTKRVDEAESERTFALQKEHTSRTELSIQIADLQEQLRSSKSENEILKEEQSRLEKNFKEMHQELLEECENLKEAIKAGSSNVEDSEKLTNELSSLLIQIRKLETENLSLSYEVKQLQTRKDSVEALKEQVRTLEKKVVIVDQLRRQLAENETQRQDLQAKQDEWLACLQSEHYPQIYENAYMQASDVESNVIETQKPSEVNAANIARYIALTKGTLDGYKSRSITLTERINALRSRNAEIEETLQQAELQNQSLNHQLEQSQNSQFKAEKAKDTAKVEVENYKRVLETYEKEAQMMSSQYNEAMGEQIRMLQEQLQSQTTEIENLTQQLDKAKETINEERLNNQDQSMSINSESREKELLQLLEQSRNAHAELEKQCIQLGKQNDDLFFRLGRGEFDQSRLQVLELKANPVSHDRIIRTSTLDALKKENAQLLSQVQELSIKAGSTDLFNSNGTSMVPLQTLENLQSDFKKLEQAMKDRDKAFDRLKEAFSSKAIEYVQAVKALFGYDMNVLSKGKVKLRSIYAKTQKGTSLTFDATTDGDESATNMKLVGEARQGAANVANLKRYWLGNDRCSVPCFLAALQLELYESTTQAVRGGWQEDADDE